jgi:hypothetical protein
MQQSLWGDEVPPRTNTTKNSHEHTVSTTIIQTAQDCPVYGHNWQTIGLSGEKRCTACGIVGYCPVCTPNPPTREAKAFYCTQHTPPAESKVSA